MSANNTAASNYTTGTDCAFTQWQVWCQDSGTSAATQAWQSWTTGGGQIPLTGRWPRMTTYPPPVLSPEEYAAAERSRAEYRERARQQEETDQRERDAAIRRAEQLLLEALSPSAQAQYRERETVTVIAKSGRVYEIAKGRARNIYELDPATRRRTARLCAHPVDEVPDQDTMLAQKLMLEHAEEEFLAMANRSAA